MLKNKHFVAAFQSLLLGATACNVFSGNGCKRGLGQGLILSLPRMVWSLLTSYESMTVVVCINRSVISLYDWLIGTMEQGEESL